MKKFISIFLFKIHVLAFIGCAYALELPTDNTIKQILTNAHIPEYSYDIQQVLGHDPSSFTEGLFLHDHHLYESTGLYGESKLRKFDLRTGKLVREYTLPANYFGEGITLFNQKIYQLTWQEQKGFVYNQDFKLQQTFSFTGQGWGLTHNDTQLIMSNGTHKLLFLNPDNFHVDRAITVSAKGTPIPYLNEIDYFQSKIYANVWPTSIVVIISPQDGNVIGWLNLSKLRPKSANPYDYVANGIALQQNDLAFVTGKNWPNLYVIRIHNE